MIVTCRNVITLNNRLANTALLLVLGVILLNVTKQAQSV